jgi:RNA polymerase sigma-70 factor, ECF subfamily
MPTPDTRPSLLLRLHDPNDREAWEAFVDLYQPVVFQMASRQGMQPADAEDLTQQVFWSIHGAINRFDPDTNKGRFRDWLRKIARHAIINALTRRKADRAIGGDDMQLLMNAQVAPESDAAEIAHEYRREIFLVAAARVREQVDDSAWRCFWETTIAGRSVDEVAKQLNRTRGSVYTARCRIMQRLRQVVERLDEESSL